MSPGSKRWSRCALCSLASNPDHDPTVDFKVLGNSCLGPLLLQQISNQRFNRCGHLVVCSTAIARLTARNPERRELWRGRWPLVSVGTYQLVCPFFELGFVLLGRTGELGYIVSNAFAKREFGQSLVERFLAEKDLQKVVDCSGLQFPGHGTPTCLIFGCNQPAISGTTIRSIVTLPGGGDLRTPPEDSPLWTTIDANHARTNGDFENAALTGRDIKRGFRSVWEDARVAVGDCSREKLLRHPVRWTFPEWGVVDVLDGQTASRFETFLSKPLGFNYDTHQDDVYKPPLQIARYLGIAWPFLRRCFPANSVRNWQVVGCEWLLSPYSARWDLEKEGKAPIFEYLRHFKPSLQNRAVFDGGTYKSAGRPWYEFHQLDLSKSRAPYPLICPEISTHVHLLVGENDSAWPRTVQVGVLTSSNDRYQHLVAGFLNSSGASFWLKQVCFNKGAGEDEERDRYVFAGNKMQQLPLPEKVVAALNGQSNALSECLMQFSQGCWQRGRQMPALAFEKLFEKPDESYNNWKSRLPGYVPPDIRLGPPYDSTESLGRAFRETQALRNHLRAEMIALQEEMDWLIYLAYGLVTEREVATEIQGEPAPLEREERPFVLWAQAGGEYDEAVKLIPAKWSTPRKRIWEARIAAIRDNEHIRRIEQLVYKRRWDEQWKVGNQWRSGPIAYAAEFAETFEVWLREKAEWWLENKKGGGPVEFDEWVEAIWNDKRVKSAWPVAAEEYARLEYEKARDRALENGDPAPSPAPPAADRTSFRQKFRAIVDEEAVPEGFPFAIAYDELEKKLRKSIPAKLRKVRGKLNVPRERFLLRNRTQYLWAGLQFK